MTRGRNGKTWAQVSASCLELLVLTDRLPALLVTRQARGVRDVVFAVAEQASSTTFNQNIRRAAGGIVDLSNTRASSRPRGRVIGVMQVLRVDRLADGRSHHADIMMS